LSVPFVTAAARRDIKSIWRYIAKDSIRHADLVEKAIVATCYSTADMPEVGHKRVDLTHRNILFVNVHGYERYTIAYVAGSQPLRILRVLHGARDVPPLFR
jgi:plasmid stabilization system protein ParE